MNVARSNSTRRASVGRSTVGGGGSPRMPLKELNTEFFFKKPVEPVLMHTFTQSPMCIVEAEPDIFYVGTSDIYASHVSYLNRIDMRGWSRGMTVDPRVILEFPEPCRALNG